MIRTSKIYIKYNMEYPILYNARKVRNMITPNFNSRLGSFTAETR